MTRPHILLRIAAPLLTAVLAALVLIPLLSLEPPRVSPSSTLPLRPASGPPNLLIILVDTLRADHLYHHGYARRTSPNIDALVARSVTFMNHYAHSSRTGPSVATLLTGLHPKSHGALNPITHWNALSRLEKDKTTLAEILSARGYGCHAIVTNANLRPRFGYAQGFSTYVFHPRGGKVEPERLKIRPPYFLYLHYMEPHCPYHAPPPFNRLWVDKGYGGKIRGTLGELNDIVTGKLDLTVRDRIHLRALYDQEIRHFDSKLKTVLATLGTRGLLQNTIIVLVADHGEELLDHGSALHGYTLYEEQLRVPLVLHMPGVRGGRRVKDITRNVDILPTLLDLMGVPHPSGLQGQSLVPLLRGERLPPGPVYAEVQLKAAKTVKLRSLMAHGWKLIENLIPTPTRELYHLGSDPAEKNDLMHKQPEMAERMQRELRELDAALPAARADHVGLTTVETKQLRSLGYIK